METGGGPGVSDMVLHGSGWMHVGYINVYTPLSSELTPKPRHHGTKTQSFVTTLSLSTQHSSFYFIRYSVSHQVL